MRRGIGTLVLAKKAYEAAVHECLCHSDTETGGILVGRKVGDDFVVPFLVTAGPKARRFANGFAPDSAWQQEFLDYLFARFGVNYVGDFHRHPGGFDRPSDHDHKTARTIVTDLTWAKPEALFPIAVIEAGTVRFRAFLMERRKKMFSEIPLEVVEDSEERMRQVLLDRGASCNEST